MSTAMERMLERKFNLTKPVAKAVAKEARESLGIGKTLVWSATYERECLRIMKENGVSKNNDPKENHFTWIPLKPQSSSKVDRREQTSTFFTDSPESSPRKIVPITMEPNSPKKEASSALSRPSFSEPHSPCKSLQAMKVAPCSPIKMRTVSSSKKTRDSSSPLKMQPTSPLRMKPSSPIKRGASLGKMATVSSMTKLDDSLGVNDPNAERNRAASPTKLRTVSPVKKRYDSIPQSTNHDKTNRVASPVKKRDDSLQQSPSKVKKRSKTTEKPATEDSTHKSPKAKKSIKTRGTGSKTEHHGSIESDRSETFSPRKEPADPKSQKSRRRSISLMDILAPPPLGEQGNVRKKSDRSIVSESETRRSRTRHESRSKLCQDNVSPTQSKVYGSLSSSASPLRRRLPISEEQHCTLNSELETGRDSTSDAAPTRSKIHSIISSTESPLKRHSPKSKETSCLEGFEMESLRACARPGDPSLCQREDVAPASCKIYRSSSASPLKRRLPKNEEPKRKIDAGREAQGVSMGGCTPKLGRDNFSTPKKDSSLSSHLKRQCPKSETNDGCASTVAETLSTTSNTVDESSTVRQLTARFETEGPRSKVKNSVCGGKEIKSSSRHFASPRRQIVCV